MEKGYTMFMKNKFYIMRSDKQRVSRDMVKQFAMEICSNFTREQIELAFKEDCEYQAWRRFIKPCRFEPKEIGIEYKYGKCLKTANGYHLEVGKVDRPTTIGNYTLDNLVFIKEV